MSEEIKKGMFSTDFLNSVKIVEDDDTQEEEINPEEVLKQQRYEKSGVPRKFFNKSLETFEWEKIELIDVVTFPYQTVPLRQVIDNYIASVKRANGNINRDLLLYGNFGTGKTHVACGLVKELGGLYRTSFQLILEYEACGNYKAEKNKLEMLDYYATVPFLAIDEIGRGIKTDVEREILMYIISQRYENDLPTVMVTNLNKDELVKLLGGAVFDRLNECCESREFRGASRR